QAEDGIRDRNVTGVQTCALPISTLTTCIVNSPNVSVSEYLYFRQIRILFCPPLATCQGICRRSLFKYSGTCPWPMLPLPRSSPRSEERRVGKECSARGGPYLYT